MPRALSIPVLGLFAIGLALLLWLEARRPLLGASQLRWLIGAMALLALGMLVALAAVPATPADTLVRALLLLVCIAGLVALARRLRSG